MILFIFSSSLIRLALLCNLPAVSIITTSAFVASALLKVSYTTEAGSAPSLPFIISTSALFAHSSSCSTAAALNVSPAPKRTFFPEVTTLEELKTKEFTKIFFLGEHDELLELEKEIENITKGEVNIAFVLEHCLEIFSKESDKANAARFLLEKDGLTLKDSVAFGDGCNDCQS